MCSVFDQIFNEKPDILQVYSPEEGILSLHEQRCLFFNYVSNLQDELGNGDLTLFNTFLIKVKDLELNGALLDACHSYYKLHKNTTDVRFYKSLFIIDDK